MKIDRISYQKTFSIGPYLTEKIGIEVQVEEGEDPGAVYKAAKQRVEQWHSEMSQLADHACDPFEPSPSGHLSDKEREERDILTAIEAAESLEALSGYKRLAGINTALNVAYVLREKELIRKL